MNNRPLLRTGKSILNDRMWVILSSADIFETDQVSLNGGNQQQSMGFYSRVQIDCV